jgi:hypothetical protein
MSAVGRVLLACWGWDIPRTFNALRFAASCAGPGRLRLMASLCLMSCSSSFFSFSSNLQARMQACVDEDV